MWRLSLKCPRILPNVTIGIYIMCIWFCRAVSNNIATQLGIFSSSALGLRKKKKNVEFWSIFIWYSPPKPNLYIIICIYRFIPRRELRKQCTRGSTWQSFHFNMCLTNKIGVSRSAFSMGLFEILKTFIPRRDSAEQSPKGVQLFLLYILLV